MECFEKHLDAKIGAIFIEISSVPGTLKRKNLNFRVGLLQENLVYLTHNFTINVTMTQWATYWKIIIK